jgi:hypothetical protein
MDPADGVQTCALPTVTVPNLMPQLAVFCPVLLMISNWISGAHEYKHRQLEGLVEFSDVYIFKSSL